MARFDVYRSKGGVGLLLDCQADLLEHLSTRLIVPLIPENDAPRPAARLNPAFVVLDVRYIMVTQFAAAIPIKELGDRICSLVEEQDQIALALDMLLVGF